MSLSDKGRDLKVILEQGRAVARRTGERLIGELKDAVESTSALGNARQTTLENQGPEPPIVARLVVEIRSDGRRTIARGAIEDAITEQKVAVLAEGTSPAQLAASLAKSLLTLPLFASGVARSLRRTASSASDSPLDVTRSPASKKEP
jgi:hypothetical protein